MRHEIAHNFGLCHTYYGGNCDANCNTSAPNFWDDVFGNPSNCPHNADWGTDAFDPNAPTPATHGKVTNNILGGNKAQGYASPKQIGQMHRALSLMTTRKYVDPCTYTPLQPIIISQNEYWDFDIRLYSDLIIQSGATLDVACKITMPCSSKIHVMPGATLKMQNGSEIIMNDNAHFFIDQNGILEYDDGVITLKGTNTLLEIKGTLDIKTNATFTFQGNGYIKFSSPPLPPNFWSDNIIAGTNSKMIFSGSGKTDKVLEITQESLYPPANLTEFTIQHGRVELGYNSRINPLGCSTQIKLFDAVFTSLNGMFNNHRGVSLYGQPGIQISSCDFENGRYGIFAAMANCSGAPLTINNSVFQNCNYGLFSTDKGVTLNSCGFSDCMLYGWYAQGMAFPCTMNSCTVNRNETGISFSAPAGGGLFVNSSGITQNDLIGIDFNGSGMLSLSCGSVTKNGLSFQDGSGIRVSSNATLNMSPQLKAGKVNATGNYTTIESNCANTFYLAIKFLS